MFEILPSFALNSRSVFYRYEGSQTTPPCFETVSWTVFQDRIKISEQLLKTFRNTLLIESKKWDAKMGDMELMVGNYRPIQLKNNRMVWTNGKGLLSSSDSQYVPTSTFMLFLLVAPHFLTLDLF